MSETQSSKPPRFFFMIAGDRISDMIDGYGIGYPSDETLNQLEDEMDRRNKPYGHTDLDDCEQEAKEAMREAGATFAVVFKGSKIYGVVTPNLTKTFEVMPEGTL